MSDKFTHFDAHGNAVMVDVTAKSVTHRRAEARCHVRNIVHASPILSEENATSGELFWSARIAGLQAAKQTASLIPLCHPLPIAASSISFVVNKGDIEISAVVETDAQTGVEMEALTACVGAALAIVDYVRAYDPGVVIDNLALWEKSGGRSGHWLREQPPARG